MRTISSALSGRPRLTTYVHRRNRPGISTKPFSSTGGLEKRNRELERLLAVAEAAGTTRRSQAVSTLDGAQRARQLTTAMAMAGIHRRKPKRG